MTLDHVGYKPRIGRMAPVAFPPEFTPVDILMAVSAFLPQYRELERRVAFRTPHESMLAIQLKPGLRVLEFGRIRHLFPRCCRVALLTPERHVPMRRCLGRSRCGSDEQDGARKERPTQPSTSRRGEVTYVFHREDSLQEWVCIIAAGPASRTPGDSRRTAKGSPQNDGFRALLLSPSACGIARTRPADVFPSRQTRSHRAKTRDPSTFLLCGTSHTLRTGRA